MSVRLSIGLRRGYRLLLAASCAASLVFAPAVQATGELQAGDPAPAFSLPGTDGNTHTLADNIGKNWVVLAWFPKAYTRGCTIECKSLAENGHLIRTYQVNYYMASVDPLDDNIGFAEQQGADFPLLSDVSKEVARAYGVLSPRGFAKRYTYYIDPDGLIAAVDSNVNPATSAEDMAAMLDRLGAAKTEDKAE